MAPQSEQPVAAEAASERNMLVEQCFWCLFYAGGIIGTLVVYGILQERIMTINYGGTNGELF
jgi:hypothetical protein